MSLRVKTWLLLAVIITLTLGVTAVFFQRYLEQSLRSSVSEGLESTAQTAALLAGKFLEDCLNEVQVIAEALPADALELRDAARIQGRLQAFMEMFPKFENGFFLLDPEGVLWADYPVHSEMRGSSFAHRQYFQKTLETRKGIIGTPYLSSRTGKPVATFTAPLKDPSGRLLGVLGCSIQLTSPLSLGGVRLTRIGRTGYIYIFDSSRMMILHPDEARILKRDVPAGANRLFDAAIQGFSGTGETVNSRGVRMLLSLRHIQHSDWILGAQLPYEEAFAPLAEAWKRILIALIGAVVLSFLVAGLVVRRITEPLEKLHQAARLLESAGNNDSPDDTGRKCAILKELDRIKGGAEIGVLAKTFREIAVKLDDSMASLRHAAADWRRTFDTVPDAIFILDHDQKILRLNRAAAELIKTSCAEAPGRDIREFIESPLPPDVEPEIVDGITSLCAEGTAVRLRHREPEVFLEVSSTPLAGESGEALGSVRVAKDVTPRIAAEREKKRLEVRLQLAQKMEAIGTLAGGIAHDFNNILAAIMGHAEISLLDLPAGSPLRSNLEAVRDACNRARDLVRQILTFSRRSTGKPQPVQLSDLVKEALNLIRPSLSAGIVLKTRVNHEALVMADPSQIHQVLMNLCTNAGHAMREKGGVLEICLDGPSPPSDTAANPPGAATGACVRLTVRDTGCGMPASIVNRIFDPFFTTKPQGEGSGLGLAVVHGIVKSHGGTIFVESAPGQGSAFHIHFPVAHDREQHRCRTDEARLTGSGRILLVDDESALVEVTARLLQKMGYTVRALTSSIAALNEFKDRPAAIDLVITDLTMPEMDGRDLARELLKIRPGLPIILCTGYGKNVPEGAALQAEGFCALLMKPYTLNDLSCAAHAALVEGDVCGLQNHDRKAAPRSGQPRRKRLAEPSFLE